VPNKFSGELKEAILAGVNGSHPLGVSVTDARRAYMRAYMAKRRA
jgi:hypothetical protein